MELTTDTIRNAIDAAIANTEDADRIARLELAREYFTNPDFRQALEDHTWNALNR